MSVIVVKPKNTKDNKDISKKLNDAEENMLKIAQANGYIEIKNYETLVNQFIDDISQMAVFKRIVNDVLAEQIRFTLIDDMLNCYIKPLFQGDDLPFIPKDKYDSIRENMYSDLLTKYVDNDEKGNDPF